MTLHQAMKRIYWLLNIRFFFLLFISLKHPVDVEVISFLFIFLQEKKKELEVVARTLSHWVLGVLECWSVMTFILQFKFHLFFLRLCSSTLNSASNKLWFYISYNKFKMKRKKKKLSLRWKLDLYHRMFKSGNIATLFSFWNMWRKKHETIQF